MSRNGTLNLHDTSVMVWEENVDEKEMHKEVYAPLIRLLRSRGFNVYRDPEIVKHYRCISWNYHAGKKGDLEVSVKLSGRCLEVVFFQNVNFENRNGGKYDFDKFQKMPYLMQKRFIIEASSVLYNLHCKHGYQYGKNLSGCSQSHVIEALRGVNQTSEPLKRFNDSWGADRFKRDEIGWPEAAQYDHGYNKDREGVPFRNGMVRWIRDRKGYLKRGVIYTNMNSMWQIIYGPGKSDTTWVSCYELFTLQPSDYRGRYFPDDHRKGRLKKELDKEVKQMKYERAAVLRDLIYGGREQTVSVAA